MTRDHHAWRDLILGYEELSPEEQKEADAHLAECAKCRHLLAGLQMLERSAGPKGTLPQLDDAEAYFLSQGETRQAEESLRALRRRLDLATESSAPAVDRVAVPRAKESRGMGRFLWPSGARGSPNWARILLPAGVAVAVLLLLSPWSRRDQVGVRDLRLLPYTGERGGDDRPLDPTGHTWRGGESFVLSFELDEPAYPVLIHVDPGGRVELLHPENPGDPLEKLPAGRNQLPTPKSGVEWTFEGEPGREAFLLAAASKPDVRLPQLIEEIELLTHDVVEREALVAAIRDLIAFRIGPVQSVEVTHLP